MQVVLPISPLENVLPIIAQDRIEGLQQQVNKITKCQDLDPK